MMPAALQPHMPVIVAVAAALAVLLLAQRYRPVRTVLNLAITCAMVGVLAMVVTERERFDPYLSQMASALNLSSQEVVGKTVRIRMAPDGHFWARAKVDGVERRMLIDSGATITALSTDTAAAARLKVRDAMFPLVLRTANGAISAQTATVGDLRLGDVTAKDLPVVVSPAFGDTDVLGMNFLSKLKSWRVEGNTLILEPHHPLPSGAS